MNQTKTTLGTLGVLLTLIVALGLNSRAVESAEAEGDGAPGPCRDLDQKTPKVWPTLRAQPKNGQYRLIQVNWDVDEVLDGDWLGVFSEDPRSIPSDDLKFVPQTTPAIDVTTPSDTGGDKFETFDARLIGGDKIRQPNNREGRKIDTHVILTNGNTSELNTSSLNSTLDDIHDETMLSATEQPLQPHRKVHQKNKDNFKGKRRKVRKKIRRKSQNVKRKLRNRQSNQSAGRTTPSSSGKHAITDSEKNKTAVNSSIDEYDDEQSGPWIRKEPSLLPTPEEEKISYFENPKLYLKNTHRQQTRAHDKHLLGDKIILIEHSSVAKSLKLPDDEDEEYVKINKSNDDRAENSREWRPINAAHFSRAVRAAEPPDEVIIITGKDEESRFGGGFSSGTENDKPILSTSAEEEHRFGGGVGVNDGTVEDRITFITDPNEENRFGGGLGIVSDYSLEDTDESSPSEDEKELDDLDIPEPTIQAPLEIFPEEAEEESVISPTNESENSEESKLESVFTTVQPELLAKITLATTQRNNAEGIEHDVIHNGTENISQSSKIQSQARGHKSNAVRTGMNGDFFRGLRDNDSDDFHGIVAVNNNKTTDTPYALRGTYSSSKEAQSNGSKKLIKRLKKRKKGNKIKNSESNKFSQVNSQNEFKTDANNNNGNNITSDFSIVMQVTTEFASEKLPELKPPNSGAQEAPERFIAGHGEMKIGRESLTKNNFEIMKVEPELVGADILTVDGRSTDSPGQVNHERNKTYQQGFNADTSGSNSFPPHSTSSALENQQDQKISKQMKIDKINLPQFSREKLRDKQSNQEDRVTRQRTGHTTAVKHEINNTLAEKTTSVEKPTSGNMVNITESDSNYTEMAATMAKESVGYLSNQENFFLTSRGDIELKVKYKGSMGEETRIESHETNDQLIESSNEKSGQYTEVKPAVTPEEEAKEEIQRSKFQNSQKRNETKTAAPSNEEYLPIDLTVEMENSDKNEVYFPIDLTVETGNSPGKNGPQESYLEKSQKVKSPVNRDYVTRTPLDGDNILTDTGDTTLKIRSSTPSAGAGRRSRNFVEAPRGRESSLTTDTIATPDDASSTRSGRRRLGYPSGEDFSYHDPYYDNGEYDSPHSRGTPRYSRDPYNKHHPHTNYDDSNDYDYYKSKESHRYDELYEDYDEYDFHKSRRKFPRKSHPFGSYGNDKHHKDYDYLNDYGSHHDSHSFHDSGHRSHKFQGYHGKHKDDPYMYEYHDLYDDYPEYQKYEDDDYDEYYATGSEPAKDVIITNDEGLVEMVDSVLRNDANTTTAAPEVDVDSTQSPPIDDVKIGDGNFLTDLRISSGNISRNLTNSNDFILITNGTNESEITIIASDLSDASDSVVRVVTSFSDTTNTSTIVLSTNDDKDPSKVVISGLEVRPSAILITGGSHSPSIVVKNARSVGELSSSGVRFKGMNESILHNILDYSMILRWYPVQNLNNFEFEVNDIAELFRINKEFHRRLSNDMEFDFFPYENRISRADKFRTFLKQKPPIKFLDEKYSLNSKERSTQREKASGEDEEMSFKSIVSERDVQIGSSEMNFDFDVDFNDDSGEDTNDQSEQSKEEKLVQTKLKFRQNSKILDYPTEDAKAPFIIEENLKTSDKTRPSQNVMNLKNDSPKHTQTQGQDMKSPHSRRRSGTATEAKMDVSKAKLTQKAKVMTTLVLTASSETEQTATTAAADYFEETTFSSSAGDNETAKNSEFSSENNSNTVNNSEFSKEEIKKLESMEQELLGAFVNRSSRMHKGYAEPEEGWSQYHPWVKFSALPTSTAGKITSTVQHARVPSSQLSEGGCVGDWVAYIRQGEVIASACIEAHPAWMWDNRDFLIDRPLEDLALLGSHNAGSLTTTDSFDAVEAWVVCQDETILDQLLYGVRHLDIRIGYYPDTQEKLWINHDAVRWAPFSTLLDDVLHFTKLSPDLVVLDIHRTPVGFEVPQATVEVLDAIQDKLGDLLYPYPSDASSKPDSSNVDDANSTLTVEAWAQGSSSKPRVTLGDIWTAGRSVLVCWGDRGMRLNNPWLWPSITQEWADAQLKSDLMRFLETASQSHSRTSVLWALMAQLTPSFWDVVLRGSVGIRGFTDRIAASVDKWLESSEWLETGSIIASDFFHSTNLISRIIDINIARAACPDLLHQRVLEGRTQRVLAERVINQWKFTMKNGSIFVEKDDEFDFFTQKSSNESQNNTLTTLSLPVDEEGSSATEEETETITQRTAQVLKLSATDN